MSSLQTSIALLTGISGSGKSILLEKLISDLCTQSISVGGIYAKGHWSQNFRSGFDLIDVETNEIHPLAFRQNPKEPFIFFNEGFLFGQKALSRALEGNFKIVILDEVGPLEIRGEGWASFLPLLFSLSSSRLIVTIRPKLIDWLVSTFHLQSPFIIETTHPTAIETLREFCEGSILPKTCTE